MKFLYYLPILALGAASMSSCNEKAKEQKMVKYDINNLDTTAIPGNDFYQYSTGGWAKANPMKDEYARYGSFDQLREKSQEDVKSIIESLGQSEHAQGSAGQKIGDLFAIAMDSAKLNAEGIAPIKPVLDEINNAKSTADIIKLMVDLQSYGRTPFMGMYVAADEKDSNNTLVALYSTGLGIGDRDYYLQDDSTSIALREGYKKLVSTQFGYLGYLATDAQKAADVVLKIETALAKSHPTKESRRNPELNYNKVKVSELNSKIANFDWSAFFAANKATGFEELNIGQTGGLKEAVKLISTLPLDETKTYLTWCLIDGSASYLSDDIYAANFDFYAKQMQGRKEMQPRWKRAVSNVEDALGEAVGQLYVQKYFPAEAKERMVELVKNLQVTLGERINNLTWMSEETKVKAQEKLNTFHVKIGYPDKWKDYSSLEIKNDSFWNNIVRASLFSKAEMIAKIGKPVDKDEWLMYPQTVNAYYMPTTNEICFPAAILQAPFFYLDGDDAVNYGAIGVVIGHEMSHGFDDQGCQYDKDGNLKNWWTADDKSRFDERAKVLVDHYNAIEVLPGLMANGTFTLGENIGDFGGIQIAYNAFEKTQQAKEAKEIEGFTPEQRFFLSYGAVWAGHIREAEMRRLTQIDPHSLTVWRVNGMLPHIDAWYKAFDIKEDAKLYLPKEKRADIW